MWSGEVTHRRRGHGVKHAGDVEHDSGRVLRPEQRNTSSMFHVLEKHVVVQREAETKNSEGRAADQKNSEQRKADTKKQRPALWNRRAEKGRAGASARLPMC